MTFGKSILDFYRCLRQPSGLPEAVNILWPWKSAEVRRIAKVFFDKYFSDDNKRTFLFGINPGRFGAGVTGICFTDPIRLAENCNIAHGLSGGAELSSDFVYRMICAFGGPELFYSQFYLTSLSPAGFVYQGKNLNYYDIDGLPDQLDSWLVESIKRQIHAGAHHAMAFSIGQGANFRYFKALNERHGFFERIEPLPHPRWIMQYKRKRLDEFIRTYVDVLNSVETDNT